MANGVVQFSAMILLSLGSWFGTKLFVLYARRHAILDLPNERSSHLIPTPRGGGAVFAGLFGAVVLLCTVLFPEDMPLWLALLGGGAVVAGVGWIDDRTPLKARYRLVAHVLAAGWALFAFGGMPSVAFGDAALSLGRWGTLFALCGGVWAINLYNFMDGIDGLAAGEAFVVAVAGALLLVREHVAVSFALFALAACVSGFLWWNWSPAKVFMGDAGSGFLGFVFFAFAVYTENAGSMSVFLWAVAGAVFIVDATLTLASRIRRGERVAQAHREHLFQRAVICGYSHAVVAGCYLCVTCALCVATMFSSYSPPVLFAATYAVLAAAWCGGRVLLRGCGPEGRGRTG